jgi:MFS family permease
MQVVAIGWQLYALTDSALDLGLLGLMQFLPVVLAVLVVGHVADRYDRRSVIMVCQIVHATAAATLAFGSAGGWLTREAIFAIVLLVGTARAFELPTMHALLPGLVPLSALSRAVAASTSATQTATIVGPALGGAIYLAGPAVAYGLCCVLFGAAGMLIGLVRVDSPPVVRRPATLSSLLGGFAFIRSHPALLGVISLDLFVVLLGSATALLPVFARDILEAGPWVLGLLRASPAAGALAASVFLAGHPLRRNVGSMMFASVIVFGLATAIFAVSTSIILSVMCLIALGAADSVSVVIRFSLVQFATPDDMRGRVSAINSLFTGTSNTLGEFRAGLTASWFSVVPAVLVGGIGAILIALVWMRAFPGLARIDNLGDESPGALAKR